MSIALEQPFQRSLEQGTCFLSPFDPALADRVAGWVRDEDELFWLAPKTTPPLSAEKVLHWPGSGSQPMFMRREESPEPLVHCHLLKLG